MKEIKVKVTFNDEVLGTASADPEIHREFVASKAPDAPSMEEEVAALGVDAMVERGMTVFPRKDGRPILYDYQIRGFFKDACSALRKVKGTESFKVKAYKKVIDGLVFVTPREIPLEFEGEVGSCQRPLRAQTAAGERVALANSETVPEGTTAEFTVMIIDDALEDLVVEWLDYGVLKGIGQWRNSGKGRFTWEVA